MHVLDGWVSRLPLFRNYVIFRSLQSKYLMRIISSKLSVNYSEAGVRDSGDGYLIVKSFPEARQQLSP